MIGRMRDILTPPGPATVGWPFLSPGLNLLARLPTRSGARTSLFVPSWTGCSSLPAPGGRARAPHP
jgi:hypothetical protein